MVAGWLAGWLHAVPQAFNGFLIFDQLLTACFSLGFQWFLKVFNAGWQAAGHSLGFQWFFQGFQRWQAGWLVGCSLFLGFQWFSQGLQWWSAGWLVPWLFTDVQWWLAGWLVGWLLLGFQR